MRLGFKTVILGLALLSLFSMAMITQGISQLPQRTLMDEYVNGLMKKNITGILIIAKGKEIQYQRSFGYAVTESQKPYTMETVFDIGSITKQFTAAAIVHLESEGKLGFSDKFSKYFENMPPDKDMITLHHLLTHSSGLQDVGGDYDHAPKESVLSRSLKQELNFKPGTKYSYSNVGFSFLAAVIEKITGLNYEQYLQKTFFGPLGMKSTGYQIPDWTNRQFAIGYFDGKKWGTTIEHGWSKTDKNAVISWNLYGNGGIHSTINDMLKWMVALKGNEVLSEKEKSKLFSPYIEDGNGHYCYGWRSLNTDYGNLITHGGSNGIFYANVAWWTEPDVLMILSVNDTGVRGLGKSPDEVFANEGLFEKYPALRERFLFFANGQFLEEIAPLIFKGQVK